MFAAFAAREDTLMAWHSAGAAAAARAAKARTPRLPHGCSIAVGGVGDLAERLAVVQWARTRAHERQMGPLGCVGRHKAARCCEKDYHLWPLSGRRYSGPSHIIPFFRLLLKKAVCGLDYESLILFC